MQSNKLDGGCYVEPYAGGAGAALFLLLQGHVKRIVINDADPVVYAFWHAAVNESKALIREIERHPPTMETREAAKKILIAPEDHSTAEVGFATFFLNRTSRSGILNGGVIGGKDQAGEYKLDARYNRAEAARQAPDDRVLTLRATLSGVEDIDLPHTIMDLQMQQMAYQTALGATAKALQPSLMDFLR